jgi:hypothetical protein
MKRRKGLPKDLEDEIISALVPILKKYIQMRKSHMNKNRIIGVGYGAFIKSTSIALMGKIRNSI